MTKERKTQNVRMSVDYTDIKTLVLYHTGANAVLIKKQKTKNKNKKIETISRITVFKCIEKYDSYMSLYYLQYPF